MKRTVTGILAHVDAGKTTLSEALLYIGGAIRKYGRVDNKDAFLDTDLAEKERGITIYTKQARLSLKGHEIILIDTPGHVDFGAEMERALSILDYAILLISAPQGVEPHTLTLWKLLASRNIPVFIFVNKMDMLLTDSSDLISELRSKLSQDIVDFSEALDKTELFYENIATQNQELLDEYLETGTIRNEIITSNIKNRTIIPCLFGSALKMSGIDDFLKIFSLYTDSAQYPSEFGGICYKITHDEKGNRLTHLKITGGSLSVKDSIMDEKVNEIRLYSGDKYEAVSFVEAGNICAVTGLGKSKVSQVYGSCKLNSKASLCPVLTYAVNYPDNIASTSVLSILHSLEEEDPSLHVMYKEETKEIFISLMGEVQTEILLRTLKEKYDTDVTLGEGKIAYRETIKNTVYGVGHYEPLRHYAEVHLLMQPLPLGSGLLFESNVSDDILSRNWQRLILTHLRERTHKGVLTSSPITDMKITVVSGKAHIKHTEGGDFRQATYRAVRQGLMQAESILLEPYYSYELVIPEEYIGRAMTDFDRMHGSFELISNENNTAVLTGEVPVVTANGYTKEVTRFSRGLGHISFSLSGYKPCHNLEEVLETMGYDPDSDITNPSSSVFCSHGSGQVIPWNEVHSVMHMPSVLDKAPEGGYDIFSVPSQLMSAIDLTLTTDEIDSILTKTAYSNSKKEVVSHKGISKEMANRQRTPKSDSHASKPVVYKGTAHKDKLILIDGYNVIYAWNELNSLANINQSAAISKLLDIISNYQGITAIPITVVFDAYRVKGHKTEITKCSNVTVVYTREAETADHYIEAFTFENSKKYDITVVTSDGIEQILTSSKGAHLISSREFELIVKNAEAQFREEHGLL